MVMPFTFPHPATILHPTALLARLMSVTGLVVGLHLAVSMGVTRPVKLPPQQRHHITIGHHLPGKKFIGIITRQIRRHAAKFCEHIPQRARSKAYAFYTDFLKS